jgi:glycosyltransferase involved in cell wall biosynthesis
LRSGWSDVWFAIPAFNEAATIGSLARQALALCPRVIIVDDCSTDGTARLVEGLSVTLLRHAGNLGKAAALKTAFAYAMDKGACGVITLDGDGQHDPADAPRLLRVWLAHPSAVIVGARLHDRAHFPRGRYYANRIACFWISWAAGQAIADTQSGFRIYPRPAMEMVLQGKTKSTRFTFESEILIEAARAGMPVLSVAIPGRYPAGARPSHFRPVLDIVKIILMVAGKLLRRGMFPAGLCRSLRRPVVLDGEDVS